MERTSVGEYSGVGKRVLGLGWFHDLYDWQFFS